MAHPLLTRIRAVPGVQSLAERIGAGRPCEAGGLWGSASALLAAGVHSLLGRPFLFVLPTASLATEAADDLETFLGFRPVPFPEIDTGDPRRMAERWRALRTLQEGGSIVASARALCQPLPGPGMCRFLSPGKPLSMEKLAEELTAARYRRTVRVEEPGELAVRGGLVDLFPFEQERPVRIEFFGDEIEAIRSFDPETQRTDDRLDVVAIRYPSEEETCHLSENMPDSLWTLIRDPADVSEEGWSERVFELSRRPRLLLQSLPGRGTTFRTLSLQRFSGALANVARELESLDRWDLMVPCATAGEAKRLEELLADAGVVRPVEAPVGRLSRGFAMDEIGLAVIPNHELFNRYRLRQAPRRAESRVIDPLLDLEEGDLVVHLTHGIGRFLRMETLKGSDYLLLEYHGGTRLFVPATNADLVQKYLGGAERAPALSALGGVAWERTKARAQKSAEELAKEMLRVQALREIRPGVSHPPDTEWQRAFEAAFPFEETEDQLEVAAEIARDMRSTRPMDRLICGDVGYGKTELAMRAAFRAVSHNRQVAVLVPTTVLAQQHYQTFRERMADYPFRVEVISRFRTKGEQRRILEELAEGKIDILIGTHRLVQKDVRFREPGLVVIDEEQRFGVEHKERLKQFRETVDVLTLSATPIPRTLHMALLGIRDISSLATPPQDRRAILTEVLRYDERRIAEAIRHELGRGGQVYFVHNRVHNIREVADRIRLIVPEARIAIGHGQMEARELEEAMLRFLAGEVDVLVATTIIESGLDIPNVNTILIHDADRFGLADLHQLRGRVGRYRNQAFCHLLLPLERTVAPQARRRIKAIEEFSELGAGFKIAMRDLEIRGVGNLLGREQSGHILAVGYDLYCRMLEKSVKGAKKERVQEPVETTVELEVDARVPESMVPDLKTRVEVYRRLCAARDLKELETARGEIEDRFGRLEDSLERLVKVLVVKLMAGMQEISHVTRGRGAVVCTYRSRERAESLRRKHGKAVRIVDETTLHLHPDRKDPLDGLTRLLS